MRLDIWKPRRAFEATWAWLCTGVLLSLLALFICRSERNGLLSERPYEEALYRVALRHHAPAFPTPEHNWSEHPCLAYVCFRFLCAFTGERLSLLREMCAALFLIAFLGSLHFALGAGVRGRTGPHARFTQEEWFRSLLVLSAFVSPLTLVAGIRIGPHVFSYLALACMLLAGAVIVESPSIGASFALGLAGVSLSFSSVYGSLVALSILIGMAAVLAALRKRHPLVYVAGATAMVSAFIILDETGQLTRFQLLRGHYWAERAYPPTSLLPFERFWNAVTDIVRDSKWMYEGLHIAALLVTIGVIIAHRDTMATAVSVALLITGASLWLCDITTQDNQIVYHWMGLVLIMGASAAARGLQGWCLRLVSVVALLVVLVPGAVACLLIPINGQQCVVNAAAEVQRLSTASAPIIFGGTRAYILFEPEIPPPLSDRCVVFLRGGAFPDSFVGRALIPPPRLVRSDEWPSIDCNEIVVVLLEGAQKVEVPVDGWRVEFRRRFVHSAYSIGEIIVERRVRARSDGATRVKLDS
jgi:hypothetical protein